jgi:glycosyltransferase involved in cell wall biosynthesis
MQLLILPSFTEGLPNVILEAMACGTPVLATPVGAIPDIVIDGKTGFIMANNSPDCVAKNIIRALNHPHLDQISQNAYKIVTETFTLEKKVIKFQEILNTF